MILKAFFHCGKSCYTFFLIVIINSLLFGGAGDFKGNNSDIYVINSAPLLNKTIMDILPWGIVIENNQTVSYKVISKIKTDKKEIAEKISLYVENVPVEINGAEFNLSFKNAVVKFKPKISDEKALRKFGFYIAGQTNRSENFEAGFIVFPRFLPDHFFVKMSASINLFDKEDNNRISGVFLGGGYEFCFGRFGLLLDINYGVKSILSDDYILNEKYDRNYDYENSKVDVVYSEVLIRYNIIDKYFSCFAGGKYSFDNVKLNGDKDYFTGCAGFCVTF